MSWWRGVLGWRSVSWRAVGLLVAFYGGGMIEGCGGGGGGCRRQGVSPAHYQLSGRHSHQIRCNASEGAGLPLYPEPSLA